MRAHGRLGSAFRLGVMMAITAGTSFAASEARAQTSRGTAALRYDVEEGLDTPLDTGFLGPSILRVRAVVKIDPVERGGPLYSVEMPEGAVLEARWGTDKKIVLGAATGAQSEGRVTVRHTLTPSLELAVSAFGYSARFAFDAGALLAKVPGARFDYDAKAAQGFAPWGFDAVTAKPAAPDLADATLFSMPFSQFPEIVAGNLAGKLGVRASAKPTFSYRTTKVTLDGASPPITKAGEEVSVPAVDGDFMEVVADVEGEMRVAGTIAVQPFVELSQVFGYSLSTSIGIDTFSKAIETPTHAIAYPPATIHIPLPNVHVPATGVDLGSVRAGGSARKTVTIENSGELLAKLRFKSSDARVKVPSGSVTVAAKGSYDLALEISASDPAPASVDVTVSSNDPDSPEQTFQVGFNGADVGGRRGDIDLDTSLSPVSSGCGCSAAGAASSWSDGMGIGVLGLGAFVLARRRRSSGGAHKAIVALGLAGVIGTGGCAAETTTGDDSRSIDTEIVGGVRSATSHSSAGFFSLRLALTSGGRTTRRLDPVCGATLIDATHALTAAHCLSARDGIAGVVVEGGAFGTGSNARTGAVVDVVRADAHPGYFRDGVIDSTHDVAILTLAAAPAGAAPASLATGFTPGCGFTTVGYGVSTPGYDPRSPSGGTHGERLFLSLCTSGLVDVPASGSTHSAAEVLPARSSAGSVCSGDSGSALFDRAGKVAGVASFILAACAAGNPGYFAPISLNRDFIDQAIRSR